MKNQNVRELIEPEESYLHQNLLIGDHNISDPNGNCDDTYTQNGGQIEDVNGKGGRHGARNQHRHKIFAKWLISRFPHILDDCVTSLNSAEAQNTKAKHILDVAGGKGELSARLSLCHSLHVVMIDPRPADVASVYVNTVVPKLPKKWKASIEKQLQKSPTFVQDLLKQRFSQLVMPFVVPSKFETCVDTALSDDDKIQEKQLFQRDMTRLLHHAVQNASLILGLHADAATEAIVDTALFYDKPFVVVPCCVFPNFFSNRRINVSLTNGLCDRNESMQTHTTKQVPVRTHEQFCQYLLGKDFRIQREVLPFEGRNIAIWWDGK